MFFTISFYTNGEQIVLHNAKYPNAAFFIPELIFYRWDFFWLVAWYPTSYGNRTEDQDLI